MTGELSAQLWGAPSWAEAVPPTPGTGPSPQGTAGTKAASETPAVQEQRPGRLHGSLVQLGSPQRPLLLGAAQATRARAGGESHPADTPARTPVCMGDSAGAVCTAQC